MKVIIVGCGKLGFGLANELAQNGDQITVISNEPKQLKALGPSFPGDTILGVGFDRDVLEKANISRADSLIACTESDETNALVARIARNHYKVPKVIARLFDQRKVAIYNALGIEVIATTEWGVSKAKELLSFNRLENVLNIGNSSVKVLRISVPELLVGRSINDIFHIAEIRVIAISRNNSGFIPTLGTRLERNDIVYVAAVAESIDTLKRILGL